MAASPSQILSPTSPTCFSDAAASIQAGHLVAFPTETVYGLGANGLNKDAVLGIFEAKQRPLTDPVILHVASLAQAKPLLDLSSPAVTRVVETLTAAFWPGPLTIVSRASDTVPPTVCANTGFVGVRCPASEIARSLIAAADTPIAAPSANRFGHVSPTTAQHVLDDLGRTPHLRVIDGGRCTVGVESSVVKINTPTTPVSCSLTLLRRGAVSASQLTSALSPLATGPEPLVCDVTTRDQSSRNLHSTPETQSEVAPGQFLRHYAPELPTFLASPAALTPASSAVHPTEGGESFDIATAVVIDFGGAFSGLSERALAYRDISPAGSFEEAAFNVFDTLRWTESVEGGGCVVLVDILADPAHSRSHLSETVYDRMFRAASGRFAKFA